MDISFRSLSMLSLRYFLIIPIVTTALLLNAWMTCKGAINFSSSIFFKTALSSSPASSSILWLDEKYARASIYNWGSSGPYFLNALMTPCVSFAAVYERKMSDRRPSCSLTRIVPSRKLDRSESSKTLEVEIGSCLPS